MDSVFAITTVTDKLKAETGSATTVFTVTNTTSRPLRGIAKIKPLGGTQAQWLKIEGETERDFPAGGTHQFTVSFNKPKSPTPPNTPQPAESFPFRLDTISAMNPDEEYTEGPQVTVEIPEQKVEPKKSFPWWIIAVAAVLLIVGGVVLWLVLRNSGGVEVPDVKTKTFAEAENALKGIGLKAERHESIAADKEINKVFDQEPAAGTKVEADSVVKVILPATTTVPRVIDLTFEQAKKPIADKELKISNPIRSKDVKNSGNPNLIGFQVPLANTTVLKGTEVKIFLPCVGLQCIKIKDDVKLTVTEKKEFMLKNPGANLDE